MLFRSVEGQPVRNGSREVPRSRSPLDDTAVNTLELQSEVVSRDEEMIPTVSTAEPASVPARDVLDNTLVRADASLFLWVFR